MEDSKKPNDVPDHDNSKIESDGNGNVPDAKVSLLGFFAVRSLAGLLVSVLGALVSTGAVGALLALGVLKSVKMVLEEGATIGDFAPGAFERTVVMLAWVAVGSFLPGYLIGFPAKGGQIHKSRVGCLGSLVSGIGIMLVVGYANYYVLCGFDRFRAEAGDLETIGLAGFMGMFFGGIAWLLWSDKLLVFKSIQKLGKY